LTQSLIVVDSAHPLVRQNRCFDPIHEYTGAGHALNVRLAREARQRGINVTTADVYLAMPNRLVQAVCLTDMVTPFTDKLFSKGARPAVCMSLESPLNAKNFYHNIARYAGRFQHNYQFRGTQARLSTTGTIFHPIVFPVETRKRLHLQAWSECNYLLLVNSNKRAVYQNWSNPKEIARSVASQAHSWALKAVDPWMRIRESYVDRIKAIRYFSGHSDFSLYGLGWDKPIQGFGDETHKAALKAYKGSIPADVRCKREVMNGFKFAICFENCIFPGYITEKIFDCFLAGCIPVYFGAPDIADFVPSQSFIDFRQFGNFADLDQFLRGMTDSQARYFQEAAQAFLGSPAFEKFTVDYFVNEVLNVMEQEFDRIG
jgi:Glycosyltransferase family 10 (fucosyltransferase) C-term